MANKAKGIGVENTIDLLKKFNFTESEAKAYIALIQNGACTGYELSKLSGVPRSKIYNILETLYNNGYVTNTRDEKTLLYKAEPIEQVIRLIKNSTEDKLYLLSKQIFNFDVEKDNEKIWNLNGYESILNKCLEMIESAEHEILIEIWADDLIERLENAVIEKQNSLGRVLVVLYDPMGMYNTKIKKVYKHRFEKQKLKEASGNRWITITIDTNEMMHATIRNEMVAESIVTKNAGMVFFAQEYIKHDAYSLRMIDEFGEEKLNEVFGDNMEGLRDIFKMK